MRQLQFSEYLFHTADLVNKVIGIHLPAVLIGDLLTLFQILHRRNNDWSMFRCSDKLVAGTMVFGKTGILSIGTFVSFGMVQTLSPRQRKLAQISNDPIQLHLISSLQLLNQGFGCCTISCPPPQD